MFTKFVLPVLAVAGVIFCVYTVVQARQPPPQAQPIVEPPTRPDKVNMIAGSGLVEAPPREHSDRREHSRSGHSGLREEGGKRQGGRSALSDRRP